MASAVSQQLRATAADVWSRFSGRATDRGKLRWMALWGAAGCLVGALIGEVLWLLAPRPALPQRQICLLIDCSGSMHQRAGREQGMNKLEEVKVAAGHFIARQDLQHDRLAVVGFGTEARTGAALSGDKAGLRRAVDLLYDGGGTNMSAGMQRAASELTPTGSAPATSAERAILLFTDGEPEDKRAALAAARACREQSIRIVAIGTGDANMRYLTELTGDPQLVFPASAGNFGESFAKAEQVLHRGSLVESGSSGLGFWQSLAMLMAWTALLGAGSSLALIAGQNLYLSRPALNSREWCVGGCGGLAAGAAAGVIAQTLFSLATAVADAPAIALLAPILVFAGRFAGWLVLGSLVGRGLACFIPNLAARYAWIGGALGGAVGSVAFVVGSLAGDTGGRLVGAAILGAMIGMMLALAEVASRSAWLEVYFGGRESVRINLGPDLVKVGSDSRACVVYARGARPLAAGYRFADGHVECIDYAAENSSTVAAGHQREIGAVRIVVRMSADETTGARSAVSSGGKAPPRPAAPKPPPPQPPAPPSDAPTAGATVKSATGGDALAVTVVPAPTIKQPPLPAPQPAPPQAGANEGPIAPRPPAQGNLTIRPVKPPPAPAPPRPKPGP